MFAGVGLGIFGGLLSWIIGYTPIGHQLNDPIYLGLSLSIIFNGLLYFNWAGFLQAFGYAVVMGIASLFLIVYLARYKNQIVSLDEAKKTAIIALVISSVPVFIREIDSIQVLLWYGVAIMFSTRLTKFVVKKLYPVVGKNN